MRVLAVIEVPKLFDRQKKEIYVDFVKRMVRLYD